MKARLGIFLLGVLLAFTPAVSLFTRKPSFYWGHPVSPIAEALFLIFGIALIYLSIFKPRLIIKQTYICPKCEETIEIIENKLKNCPTCGVKLEKLKGFYKK
jgi:DNA-directed RNA polymerase subunit RPC12/RpoP